ncbi:DUF2512 family protein [Bacillus sp. V5-8f]|uniref:DUF2512 family protein n=1 Tax=Bacillus sp. V5-8f TaxID=2053044 RepID=UPI000C76F526|nr:DUF2512 family protein [Bacillus sp. V5-8f]PLT32760.1 hypothetical protein CUU64_16535 [Bacillus sp. V5-8f]
MRNHGTAILVKFISLLVVLGVILWLNFDYRFTDVVLIVLVLTIVGYVLGDLFILRRSNNTAATIADFGLTFAVVWIMSRMLGYDDGIVAASALSAVAVAVVEYLYHKIVPGVSPEKGEKQETQDRHIRNQPFKLAWNQSPGHERLQTEAGEELTPIRPGAPSPQMQREYKKSVKVNKHNKNKNKNK